MQNNPALLNLRISVHAIATQQKIFATNIQGMVKNTLSLFAIILFKKIGWIKKEIFNKSSPPECLAGGVC